MGAKVGFVVKQKCVTFALHQKERVDVLHFPAFSIICRMLSIIIYNANTEGVSSGLLL